MVCGLWTVLNGLCYFNLLDTTSEVKVSHPSLLFVSLSVPTMVYFECVVFIHRFAVNDLQETSFLISFMSYPAETSFVNKNRWSQ